MMKLCRTCGETKPLADFHKAAKGGQGRFHKCRVCAGKKYAAQREHVLRRTKAWNQTNFDRDPKMFTVKNLITAAKQRAKQFGVPFDLVFEDLGAPDICPVLQVPLDYSRKGKGGHRWNSPSIDRMVPERGYVKGNVAIISFRANTIKSNATPDELYRVYKYAGSRT